LPWGGIEYGPDWRLVWAALSMWGNAKVTLASSNGTAKVFILNEAARRFACSVQIEERGAQDQQSHGYMGRDSDTPVL
jgi:hypothetical protein